MNPRGKLKIKPDTVKKILLIRLRRIGDIVMTTPAAEVLKASFPGAKISYMVEHTYKDLVEGNPNFDEVIDVPPRMGKKAFFQLARMIRRKRYDMVIDFHGGPRASLLTALSGARLKIGYRIRYRHFLYHVRLPRRPDSGHFHSVENHVNLVKAAGVHIEDIPPLSLAPPRGEDISLVDLALREEGLSRGSYVVLHIGAGNAFREWGSDNLIRLAELIGARSSRRVILIGGNEDRETAEEIIQRSSSPPVSWVSRFNLRQLQEVISPATLFIGPDSGPMHIAASTPTPIVALFGPTIPANFAPWKAEAVMIEKGMECRPCRQKKCLHEDFRCLGKITPEEVYAAVDTYLKKMDSG